MPNEILDQPTSPKNLIDFDKRLKFNKVLLGLAALLGIPNIVITNTYSPSEFSRIIHLSRFQTTALVVGSITIATALAITALVRIVLDIRRKRKL